MHKGKVGALSLLSKSVLTTLIVAGGYHDFYHPDFDSELYQILGSQRKILFYHGS